MDDETLEQLCGAIRRVGNAITPNICGSSDATGAHVESLTESMMGVTAALVQIANAISDLAEAVREHKE